MDDSNKWYKKKKKIVSTAELRSRRNPGSNQGPLDLQSNALPTELFRQTRKYVLKQVVIFISWHYPIQSKYRIAA